MTAKQRREALADEFIKPAEHPYLAKIRKRKEKPP